VAESGSSAVNSWETHQQLRLEPGDQLDIYDLVCQTVNGYTRAYSRYLVGYGLVQMGRKEDAMRVYKALQKLDPSAAEILLAEINKMQ
jgi:hypothetical protein